jgi:hypothetical protein
MAFFWQPAIAAKSTGGSGRLDWLTDPFDDPPFKFGVGTI